MATEIRNSEVRAVYGKVSFCGLDGKSRDEVTDSLRAEQQKVRQNMAHLLDDSPAAKERRVPNVLKNLTAILAYKKFNENDPFYQRRLQEARNGGYLPKEPIQIILISVPARELVAV